MNHLKGSLRPAPRLVRTHKHGTKKRSSELEELKERLEQAELTIRWLRAEKEQASRPEQITPVGPESRPAEAFGQLAFQAEPLSRVHDANEITQSRQLVEELARRHDELEASHARIQTILASLTEGYTSLDREFRIVEANAAAERMHERTREQLVGTYLYDIFPEVRDTEFYEQYRRALTHNEPVHFEAPTALGDRWYEVHAYPNPQGLDVYFHDITDRKKAEVAVKNSEERYLELVELSPDGIVLHTQARLSLRTRRRRN